MRTLARAACNMTATNGVLMTHSLIWVGWTVLHTDGTYMKPAAWTVNNTEKGCKLKEHKNLTVIVSICIN